MEFVSAKCPSCSGELKLPKDREILKCMYCGCNVVVKKAIQAYQGVNISGLFALAEQSRGSAAREFYTRILEVDPLNVSAWIGRGANGGGFNCFDKAIELADDKPAVRTEIIRKIWWSIDQCTASAIDYEKSKAEYILKLDPTDPVALLCVAFGAVAADRATRMAHCKLLKEVAGDHPRLRELAETMADWRLSYCPDNSDDFYDCRIDPLGFYEMLSMLGIYVKRRRI